MNSHDEDPVQILRYIQGDLNREESVEFHRHLRVCSACRACVEKEKALSRLLQKAAPLYTAPAELRARVAALSAIEFPSRNNLRTELRATGGRIRGEIEELCHSCTRR